MRFDAEHVRFILLEGRSTSVVPWRDKTSVKKETKKVCHVHTCVCALRGVGRVPTPCKDTRNDPMYHCGLGASNNILPDDPSYRDEQCLSG